MVKFIRIIIMVLSISAVVQSCKKNNGKTVTIENKVVDTEAAFDSTAVNSFFTRYPDLKEYEPQVRALYRKHQWHYIWYDKGGVNELADLLHSKINTIESEGIRAKVPYQDKLDTIFEDSENLKADPEHEYLISSLYFFYADKVFHGLDVKTSQELGWYLPRKKVSYVNYLDSLIADPKRINKDEKEVLGQYYRLKGSLQKYQELAHQKKAFDSIPYQEKMVGLKVGDSATVISKIRERLVLLGHLNSDSKSNIYDKEMAQAVIKYKQTVSLPPSNKISLKTVAALNVSLENRIKTLMVNMERCRWIPSGITKSEEYIVINIPSYQLVYFKKAEPVLRMNVVVGKIMNQTVIFSGMMKFIVFSPYWNVPKSIVEKEIKPGIKKNPNYLAEHNMESVKGQIRQKPGPANSLGLVKFLFPNSNNIYLHDSPAKSLFDRNSRAFSHGCIRVQKPVELANKILENDKVWTSEKIDSTMHGGKEVWHTLKNKIPVYIGYFTAWVDDQGVTHFYDDVYKRDAGLAEKLFKD